MHRIYPAFWRLFAVILIAPLPSVLAGDTAATPSTTVAPNPAPAAALNPADLAWKELENVLRGPQQQPKTREEAIAWAKATIAQIDEKGDTFLKAFPSDSRRWDLLATLAGSQKVRGAVGLPTKDQGEVLKDLEAVLAAPDASSEAKSQASFIRLTFSAGKDESAFRRLADEHLKAYPNFPANPRIVEELARLDAQKDLASKPLDLKFTAVDGTAVDLSTLKGKVVLVDFWATWCGPCMREVPNVVATYQKYHDKGFEIIGISFDQDKAKLLAVTQEKSMTWKQYFDGKGWENDFGRRFGIDSIPRMWLVNKKGMVVDKEGRDDLANKVEKLLAEQ